MRAALVVVVFLMLSGCSSRPVASPPASSSPAVPADLSGLRSFEETGRECWELVLFATASAADVRPFVPATYLMVGEPGAVTLVVDGMKCVDLAVAGGKDGAGNVSDVGVLIEPPDGSGDLSVYGLWQPTNREDHAARDRALGLRTFDAPLLDVRGSPSGGVKTPGNGRASFKVPWEANAYAADAQVGLVSPKTAPFTRTVWWHDSEKGTVRVTHTVSPADLYSAAGTVTAGAGSDMAKVLGGSGVQGAGAFWSFGIASEYKLV